MAAGNRRLLKLRPARIRVVSMGLKIIQIKKNYPCIVTKQACHEFNKVCGTKMKMVEIDELLNTSNNKCYLSELGKTIGINGNTINSSNAAYICIQPENITTVNGNQLFAWLHRKRDSKWGRLMFGTEKDFNTFVAKMNLCGIGCLQFETGNEKDAFCDKLFKTVKKGTFETMKELKNYLETKIDLTMRDCDGKIDTHLNANNGYEIYLKGELQDGNKLYKPMVKTMKKVKPIIKMGIKLVLVAVMLLAGNGVWAQIVERDVRYQITSHTFPYTAAVVQYTTGYYSYFYSGSINIKDTIEYNGTTYTVTAIDDYAFYGCSNLTNVSIPNTVKTIGSYSFIGSGITTITIPDSVVSIGTYAFYNSQLTSVTIGNSVKNVGRFAFNSGQLARTNYTGTISQWCSINFESYSANPVFNSQNLYINNQLVTELTFPNNVDTIKKATFINDTCIKSIVFGDSVKHIADSAFWGCSSIDTLTFLRQMPPTTGRFWKSGVPGNAIYRIPCGSYPWYLNALGTAIIIESPFYTFSVMSEDTLKGNAQVLSPTTCTNPQSVIYAVANNGYTFSHWSDNNVQNPRTLTVTQDTALIAYFTQTTPQQWYNFAVIPEDTTKGTVQVFAQPSQASPQATFIALPKAGYDFSHWNDNNTQNPRSITVTQDTILVAYFTRQTQQWYNFIAVSEDNTKGTVQIVTQPTQASPQATIIALPNTGYTFARWSDGNTQNPRTLTVTQDTVLIAYFTSNQGIAEAENDIISVRTANGNILLEGVSGERVYVSDVLGRVIYNATVNERAEIAVRNSGVYFVKVGNRPARKVVVVR